MVTVLVATDEQLLLRRLKASLHRGLLATDLDWFCVAAWDENISILAATTLLV
jgi:hypothetical protein